MNQILNIILLLLFWPCYAAAQKEYTTDEQLWLGSSNQLRISDKWGASADIQLRFREKFIKGIAQSNIRAGAVYVVNDRLRLAAGHAFFQHVQGPQSNRVLQTEHSPWQQVSWFNKQQRLSINQSVRLEERFRRKMENGKLADGYTFSYRARYNILFNYALSKHPSAVGAIDAVAYNELFINFGRQIVYNTFDQYRFFAGFNYHVTDRATLQFGYLNIFQQLSAGHRFRRIHLARIFYLYNLDLRKKHPRVKPPNEVSHHKPIHLS